MAKYGRPDKGAFMPWLGGISSNRRGSPQPLASAQQVERIVGRAVKSAMQGYGNTVRFPNGNLASRRRRR